MPDNNENGVGIESQANEDQPMDYVAAIVEMQRSTVSRDKYDKLMEENKKLLNALVKGERLPQQEEKADVSELRKKLYSGDNDMSNLEYIEASLKLRQAVMENGGIDPFLPMGQKILPDEADIAAADKVAQVLQECIDYADGDSQVFTNELQRRLIDTSPKNKK